MELFPDLWCGPSLVLSDSGQILALQQLNAGVAIQLPHQLGSSLECLQALALLTRYKANYWNVSDLSAPRARSRTCVMKNKPTTGEGDGHVPRTAAGLAGALLDKYDGLSSPHSSDWLDFSSQLTSASTVSPRLIPSIALSEKMPRSVTLVATAAALSWAGAGASPLAFTRRAAAQIPGYDFTGCYTEAINMRALTGSSYFDDLMTVEKCANACVGFKYFGIEYGRECYCGNNINGGSVEAPLADCSFACPGDASETCGAGNRLDLYTRTTDPEVPTLTDYSSRGCYAEPPNSRALGGPATRADDMTVDKCADFCGDAGYTLFGLEYYTEVNILCSLQGTR